MNPGELIITWRGATVHSYIRLLSDDRYEWSDWEVPVVDIPRRGVGILVSFVGPLTYVNPKVDKWLVFTVFPTIVGWTGAELIEEL